MKNKQVTPRCPIRTTLELIGGKWKLLILFQMKGNALRLSELRMAIPDISEKMLIQELKVLVDNELVKRRNFGEVPPRVEYSLTAAGKRALPLIEQIADYGHYYHRRLKVQSN
jgi:DNA-binding HxlR family transcriptional regulator